MRLRVTVEVLDEEAGKKTRRRKEIEVPPRVLNVNKALCETRMELRRFVANDVMSAALASMISVQAPTQALEEAMRQPASQGGEAARGAKGMNKLESFLGLDVINHMDKLDGPSTKQQPPLTPDKLSGWEALGFGGDESR
jgi:hypothetical protein